MAQNINISIDNSNKDKVSSSSASVNIPCAQATVSRYLEEQEAEHLNMYYKYLKQKNEAGNFIGFSIFCPLLHFLDISEFKVSSQRNVNNTQQAHSTAAAAHRRKCNSVSTKYFNYGEKSTFQHGISAGEALEEYRKANMYSRSRMYKSNQDALEISMLLKSDIQRITGTAKVNDILCTKPSTASFVTPCDIANADVCDMSLQDRNSKRRPTAKVSLAHHRKHKERPAVPMSIVCLGMETTTQVNQHLYFKPKQYASTRDIRAYKGHSIENSLYQSASDANIFSSVQRISREKLKDRPLVKQRFGTIITKEKETQQNMEQPDSILGISQKLLLNVRDAAGKPLEGVHVSLPPFQRQDRSLKQPRQC